VPNTYIKAVKYANLAVAALFRDTVLTNTVTRTDGAAFRGALDDTITFKMPGVTVARDYEWRTRVNPIVLDKIGRSVISIKLDTHTYNAIPITDEELTLDLENFSREVLVPQSEALGKRLDGKIAAALRAAPFKNTALNAAEATDTNPYKWALKASALLDGYGTPRSGRQLIVGLNPWVWLMSSDQLVKMDPAQATTAYREAVAGRIANFDILTAPEVGVNEIFAVHPSWAVLANVAPENPEGATYSAQANYQGYGVRVLKDYDPNFLRDRSILSTFTGISTVKDELQVDGNGNPVLDGNGNPQYTNVSVRGARGTFTPAP